MHFALHARLEGINELSYSRRSKHDTRDCALERLQLQGVAFRLEAM